MQSVLTRERTVKGVIGIGSAKVGGATKGNVAQETTKEESSHDKDTSIS